MNFLAVPCLALFLAACSGGQQSTEGASPDQEGEPQTMNMVVRATPRGTDEILVTWVDRLADESGYVVERKGPDDEDFQLAVVLGPNRMSWLDSNRTEGAAYRYRVSAIQGGQGILAVEEPVATTLSVDSFLPAAPVLLRVKPLDYQSAQLFWLDCADNETGFVITAQVYAFPMPDPIVLNIPADATSAVLSGLAAGTGYSITLHAVNGNGKSTDSSSGVQTLGEPNTRIPNGFNFYTYDDSGRKVVEEVNLGPVQNMIYYSRNEDETVVTLEYDFGNDGDIDCTATNTYDALGNLLLRDSSACNGQVLSNAYDDLGRMVNTELTINGTSVSATQTIYDDEARTKVVRSGNSQTVWSYDAHWHVREYAEKSGEATTYSEVHNSFGRIWAAWDYSGDGVLDHVELMPRQTQPFYTVGAYDFDSDGLVDEIEQAAGSQNSDLPYFYWYDGIGRDFVPEQYKYRKFTDFDAEHYMMEEGEMEDDNSDGVPEHTYIESTLVLKTDYPGVTPE